MRAWCARQLGVVALFVASAGCATTRTFTAPPPGATATADESVEVDGWGATTAST